MKPSKTKWTTKCTDIVTFDTFEGTPHVAEAVFFSTDGERKVSQKLYMAEGTIVICPGCGKHFELCFGSRTPCSTCEDHPMMLYIDDLVAHYKAKLAGTV